MAKRPTGRTSDEFIDRLLGKLLDGLDEFLEREKAKEAGKASRSRRKRRKKGGASCG